MKKDSNERLRILNRMVKYYKEDLAGKDTLIDRLYIFNFVIK